MFQDRPKEAIVLGLLGVQEVMLASWDLIAMNEKKRSNQSLATRQRMLTFSAHQCRPLAEYIKAFCRSFSHDRTP